MKIHGFQFNRTKKSSGSAELVEMIILKQYLGAPSNGAGMVDYLGKIHHHK